MLSVTEYLSLKPHRPAEEAATHDVHIRLTRWNAQRLTPALPSHDWIDDLRLEADATFEEGIFVERERRAVSGQAATAPTDADTFIQWFENLRAVGPGQHDSLFPWLASSATLEQMRWFLTQEAAGEAGFEDLVAMTQIRFPARPKLEMARNYWDEMGRGSERGMHGPMLANVVTTMSLDPRPEGTVWESLALANLMVALAANRRYAYQAVGALGVVEMTAPGRVSLVNEGLKRLNAPTAARMYFQLHAGLDIKHSKTWNREVIWPLVNSNPGVAAAIAEGALMRLTAGLRCFRRYRTHFGFRSRAYAPGQYAR